MAIVYCKSSMFFLLAITLLFICSSYANHNDVPDTRIGDRKLIGPVGSTIINLITKAGRQTLAQFKSPTAGFKKIVKTGFRFDRVRKKVEKACDAFHNCISTEPVRTNECNIYHCVYSVIKPQICEQVCGPVPKPNCFSYPTKPKEFFCN